VQAGKPLALSDGKRTLTLADGAKTTLNFPLTAQDGYGVGTLTVAADAGPDIEIRRTFELAVRPAWPSVLRSRPAVLEQLAPITLGAGELDGLLPDSVTARLTVTSLPPLPFAAALQGLLQYPYGCAEQTTSKGYGALLLDGASADKLGV